MSLRSVFGSAAASRAESLERFPSWAPSKALGAVPEDAERIRRKASSLLRPRQLLPIASKNSTTRAPSIVSFMTPMAADQSYMEPEAAPR